MQPTAVGQKRFVHPLEVAGPSTILGERPPWLDPVVVELGRLLEEKILEATRAKDEIEVEIRLGAIMLSRN
eukprot:1421038-Amphidinium_carterae.1